MMPHAYDRRRSVAIHNTANDVRKIPAPIGTATFAWMLRRRTHMIAAKVRQFFRPPLRYALLIFSMAGAIHSDPARIRLNQLGFYTDGPKTAIAVSPETWYFSVRSPDLRTTYYSGELSEQSVWAASGEKVKCAVFSSFNRPGSYVVYITGMGASYTFTIAESSLKEVTRGLIKAFYYQRASTALPQPYAGNWSRPAGHGDTRVAVHASAASDPEKPNARKEGDIHPSPGGWYDAGDYGKYVVNAGITTYELLLLYERFPGYFDRFGLNIPEPDGGMPDILDEVKWELDWLLTMQDDADGGVYHKLTSPTFCGDVMPANDRDARFFIGKGSAAAFDFAAVLATAYRIYKKRLPPFADSCLAAARRAWQWGREHPDSTFSNPPGVVTGEYGDRNLADELQWAAFELFIATGDSAYYRAGMEVTPGYGIPDWQKVAMLGCYSMALCNGDSPAREKIIGAAATLLKRTRTTPYRTSIVSEFGWGSNSVVANQGICMIIAYLLTGNIDYLIGAVDACDYLLGRNALGYSFITGYGARTPQHPHHRPSTADGVSAPVPGLLSGGPNAQAGGEGCTEQYPAARAQKWLDQACSYTTNEVAVNWNAAAAFLTGAIDALITDSATVRQALRDRFSPDTAPPSSLTLAISGVRGDRVTAAWKTAEAAAVTLSYNPATSPDDIRRIICGRADSASVTLPGLLPETVYRVRCIAVDPNGNAITAVDSFRTETGAFDAAPFIRHTRGICTPGKPLTVSVSPETSGSVDATLTYTTGGNAAVNATPFAVSGDSLVATIPANHVSVDGIIYSITAVAGADTFSSPSRAVAPDSFSLTNTSISTAAAYRLASFPGIFAPRTPPDALSGALGDTTEWRYFGYTTATGLYAPFDSVSSGRGGWLYHKEQREITWTAHGIPPDTLFPLSLRAGWNCIGSPFPFPVYWDNMLVRCSDGLVPITDPAAAVFVRRQFFSYADTLPDNVNNGYYLSNRKLDSHVFDTSAQLRPWEGCWIFAERDSATVLLNPLPSSYSRPLRKIREAPPRSWFLNLDVESGDRIDGPLVLGASEAATDGYDQFDTPKPPAITSEISADFSHPEWLRAARLYASDIVTLKNSGLHRWIIDVSFRAQRRVSITWRPTGTIDGSISFVDSASGECGPVFEGGGYSFTPKNGETSRKIAFVWSGGASAPRGAATPSLWSFTRIPGKTGAFAYTIPRLTTAWCDVSVEIYDIRGRRVCTLRRGAHAPGAYRTEWGRAADRSAAPGRYIARLSSAAFSKNIGFNIVN